MLRYRAIYCEKGNLVLGEECRSIPECNSKGKPIGHVKYHPLRPNKLKIMHMQDYVEEWIRA